MFGFLLRRSPAWRCYVRLDSEGRCLSAWKLQRPPDGPGWMEVDDFDPVRIGQPLQPPLGTIEPQQ